MKIKQIYHITGGICNLQNKDHSCVGDTKVRTKFLIFNTFFPQNASVLLQDKTIINS